MIVYEAYDTVRFSIKILNSNLLFKTAISMPFKGPFIRARTGPISATLDIFHPSFT